MTTHAERHKIIKRNRGKLRRHKLLAKRYEEKAEKLAYELAVLRQKVNKVCALAAWHKGRVEFLDNENYRLNRTCAETCPHH